MFIRGFDVLGETKVSDVSLQILEPHQLFLDGNASRNQNKLLVLSNHMRYIYGIRTCDTHIKLLVPSIHMQRI